MNPPIWNILSRRQRKIAAWVVGLVLLYTVAGFLILPPIVRHVAVKQLAKQLDRPASIQSVKINPYVLSADVRGLLIQGKDGAPFVSWDEVYVNLQLASFFGHAWVFKEIKIIKPYVRGQMNKDGTFNFSDLVAKFSATNNAAPKTEPARPLALHVGRLQITGARLAVADFTPRAPFQRVLGPLDITLDDFRTDPDNRNPYSFAGTTDAGERIAWTGFFYLDPLRSQGHLQLLNFALNKYAPLYQDFVSFVIHGGTAGLDLNYRFDLSASNRVCEVTNTSVGLRDFALGHAGESNNVVTLPALSVTGINADLHRHAGTIGAVMLSGANLSLVRGKDAALNVVELAKPSATAPNESGGIALLLQSVTNAVSLLLHSTNQWAGLVRDVSVTNCAVHFEDDANSRPATLDLSDIALTAKNLSNLPGTNLEAQLSLRWNTNGMIKATASASFLPPTADVRLDLDQLGLATLDPYLEPKLNLFIRGSQVSLHGNVRLRSRPEQLPKVSFDGDASLDGFHAVDGVFGQDLLKWDAIKFDGIQTQLNPLSVAIRQIDVNHAYARVIVETNHTLNLANAFSPAGGNAPATNKTETAAAAKTSSPPPQISIGAIVITNSEVDFSDRSIQPAVNLSLRDLQGRVAGLSTRELDHAQVTLAAKIDGVGPADITGVINPLNGAQTNEIKVVVKNVDLTPVSPYAAKYAGYGIAEGKLNLDLAYELAGRQLRAKNVVTLDQFNFGEKVDSPDATHLPVRLAVALLKDREGKIVLDLPVDGNLGDPKFRVGKVVIRAVVNILTKAATSPFSLLGAAFGGGGEELGYQDFAPGSAALTDADRQKLDALQKALLARPALRLEITGGIDPEGDREGLQRAALDRQIRDALWQKVSASERAGGSLDQLVVSPEIRAKWMRKLYDAAVAGGKITPATTAAPAGGQSKLSPPPNAQETALLATIPVTDTDFAALATARATRVRDYLVEHGQVDAGRLFLKAGGVEALRRDGSRAWLQLE